MLTRKAKFKSWLRKTINYKWPYCRFSGTIDYMPTCLHCRNREATSANYCGTWKYKMYGKRK